jgi:hypothetical protein
MNINGIEPGSVPFESRAFNYARRGCRNRKFARGRDAFLGVRARVQLRAKLCSFAALAKLDKTGETSLRKQREGSHRARARKRNERRPVCACICVCRAVVRVVQPRLNVVNWLYFPGPLYQPLFVAFPRRLIPENVLTKWRGRRGRRAPRPPADTLAHSPPAPRPFTPKGNPRTRPPRLTFRK